MNRREVLESFARFRGDAPTVVGPGVSGRMLYEIDHRPATLYQMDMSYPVPIGLGLALALPSAQVFAVDGDGSLLMGLSGLTTVGRYNPANLTIVVLDNHAYVSTGSIPTATATGCDLAAVGRASGIANCVTATTPAEFDKAMESAATADGASLIVADLREPDPLTGGNYRAMPFDIVESSLRFRQYLVETGAVAPIWAV
ncbi:thiamine pyrophosphate-dependent enzyme [Streptosporangium sp. NPDC051022]|uniref:thiamine pyrophosphate-dependent enzyme n=1 Tax=Streptosporangium sp. NPDC051022 TaxID=3155752 RepID=UPI003424BD76